MANAKYDYLTEMMATGMFSWPSDHILALLMKGVTFYSTDKRLSEVQARVGAIHMATSEVTSRYVASDGSAIGLPATFTMVPRAIDYQVLLVKDEGTPDPALVAFYDVDQGDAPLRLINNGTLIVRPVDIPGSEIPTVGVWFKI
jgi:hypothetical protein